MPKDDGFGDDDFGEVEDDPEVVAYLESLSDGVIDVARMPPHIADKLFGAVMPGIRCPKCQWRPRSKMKWVCDCRHVWNTFATRGKCPGCPKQWTETHCSGCREWSPHDDWYEPRGLPS